jgi:hypothetical protein
MPDGNVTAFRFSEEELELLGVIQGHTGIHSRMEALRAVLRYYVEAEGLSAPTATPSPRSLGSSEDSVNPATPQAKQDAK